MIGPGGGGVFEAEIEIVDAGDPPIHAVHPFGQSGVARMGVQDGHVLDDQVPHGLTGVGHQGAQKDLESHPLVDPFDYLGNPGPFRRGVHPHLMGVDPW